VTAVGALGDDLIMELRKTFEEREPREDIVGSAAVELQCAKKPE
jgi:hypothetical protein